MVIHSVCVVSTSYNFKWRIQYLLYPHHQNVGKRIFLSKNNRITHRPKNCVYGFRLYYNLFYLYWSVFLKNKKKLSPYKFSPNLFSIKDIQRNSSVHKYLVSNNVLTIFQKKPFLAIFTLDIECPCHKFVAPDAQVQVRREPTSLRLRKLFDFARVFTEPWICFLPEIFEINSFFSKKFDIFLPTIIPTGESKIISYGGTE